MKEIVEKLIELNKTISTMESCTGGYVVNAITNIPGASNVLKYSAVTYANEFKIKMGVDKELIDKYTVYSQEVADDMSLKISNFANSNYGVGVTGKLLRQDDFNKFGKDNEVFISIYNKDKDYYLKSKLAVIYETREENKDYVLKEIERLLKDDLGL